MPITYDQQRRRWVSSPSMSSDSEDTDNENETGDLRPPGTAAPAVIDADESIVLSDLVRTGEASRLRRRGAMRLDHGSAGPLPMVTVRPASWDEEAEGLPEEDVEEGETIGSPVFSRTERDRNIRYSRLQQRERDARRRNASAHQQHHNDDEYKYTLICGGVDEDADTWRDDAAEPWTPSILPIFPSTQRRPSIRMPHRRTNGCGALIHMHASPRQRMSVWTAKTQASAAVISMDPSYFDRTAVAKIVRSACGCVREGVGCAVCGNPLGTRYKPCRTAGDGIFSSSSHSSSSRTKTSSTPLRPEGSRYWHAQLHPSSGDSHDNDFYVYTFFSAAVTSHPPFAFPFHSTSAAATTQRAAQARPESRSRLRAQRANTRPIPPPQPQPPMSPLSPVYSFDNNPVANASPDPDPETPETYTSVTPPIFSDRLVTESPTPLSDPEIVTINRSGNNSSALPGGDYDGDRAMAFGYLRQPGVEFDPDGEFFFGPASEGTYAYGPGLGQGLYGGDGDGDDENKAVDVRMLFPER